LFIHKGYRLPHDLPLLSSVFFLLTYYTMLLKMSPIQDVISLIERNCSPNKLKTETSPSEYIVLKKVYRAATFFIRRIWRSSRPCLRRTLILHRWCCHYGILSKVIIGVHKKDSNLKSHAWLEIDGQPFMEKQERLSIYTPIFGEKTMSDF